MLRGFDWGSRRGSKPDAIPPEPERSKPEKLLAFLQDFGKGLRWADTLDTQEKLDTFATRLTSELEKLWPPSSDHSNLYDLEKTAVESFKTNGSLFHPVVSAVIANYIGEHKKESMIERELSNMCVLTRISTHSKHQLRRWPSVEQLTDEQYRVQMQWVDDKLKPLLTKEQAVEAIAASNRDRGYGSQYMDLIERLEVRKMSPVVNFIADVHILSQAMRENKGVTAEQVMSRMDFHAKDRYQNNIYHLLAPVFAGTAIHPAATMINVLRKIQTLDVKDNPNRRGAWGIDTLITKMEWNSKRIVVTELLPTLLKEKSKGENPWLDYGKYLASIGEDKAANGIHIIEAWPGMAHHEEVERIIRLLGASINDSENHAPLWSKLSKYVAEYHPSLSEYMFLEACNVKDTAHRSMYVLATIENNRVAMLEFLRRLEDPSNHLRTRELEFSSEVADKVREYLTQRGVQDTSWLDTAFEASAQQQSLRKPTAYENTSVRVQDLKIQHSEPETQFNGIQT